MIVLSQCCNKWAENGINALLTFNFVHNKVIKLAAVKREQLAAEAEMARLERRDSLLCKKRRREYDFIFTTHVFIKTTIIFAK